jgi:serine/threonine-protein kinase
MMAHPNLLGVLDFGQIDGLAFVSSPFVHGMSLRFVIAECRQVPLTPAFLLARQIADGLRAAHQQRLVHGALKPENVLVEPAGGVRVMDFGHAPPVTPLTRDAAHPGAPYLAPEQIDGHPAGARSDVYAWGAVTYEMVTGQVPAAGATPNEVSFKRAEAGLEPPSVLAADLPPELEAILLRCLEMKPSSRYASIEELIRELDALRE